MYDLIQSALTAVTQLIALAGLTGIFAHALYTRHCNFMTEFCPPVAPSNFMEIFPESLEGDRFLYQSQTNRPPENP